MNIELRDFFSGFIQKEKSSKINITSSDKDKQFLNKVLSKVKIVDFNKFASSIKNEPLMGFEFFDYVELIDNENKENFLKITWAMFKHYTSLTDYHPWRGSFNPCQNELIGSKYVKWFREGVIRFELNNQLSELEYTYFYWEDIKHFLSEVKEFQTKVFFQKSLEVISYWLKKKIFF